MRDCEFLINNSVVLELSLKLKLRAPLPLSSTGAASGTPGLRPRRALLYRAPLLLPVTYSRLGRYSHLQPLGMPTARSREAALRRSRGSRARSLPLEPRPGRAGPARRAQRSRQGAPERVPGRDRGTGEMWEASGNGNVGSTLVAIGMGATAG